MDLSLKVQSGFGATLNETSTEGNPRICLIKRSGVIQSGWKKVDFFEEKACTF
jgi:hypothetical protein